MNFQTICRICTGENSKMTSIFESCNFWPSNSEIFQVITDCASVRIRKSDGFSENICQSCLEHLSQAYNFKKLCEESDYKFRNGLITSNAIYIKSEDSFITERDENSDESNQMTHCGLTEVKQEQCDDDIPIAKNDEIEQDEVDFSASVFLNLEVEQKSSGAPNKYDRTSLVERKKFKCDVCEKEFTQRSSLSRHTRLHTGEYLYECNVCGKKFTQSGNFEAHVRSHTGEKPFECNFCEKKFTTSGSLAAHFRIHTGEKPYNCNDCSKKFTTSSALTSHVLTHSEEKQYKCEFCDKKFAKTTNLNRHMRMHTGEKRYKCDICQKRFTHSSNLKRHIRKHTGETPYHCDFCEKRFTQSSSLARHIHRLHRQ